jgi:hypothetical protein
LTLPTTAVGWQQLLDEKFPEGAQVSLVLPDGTLSPDSQSGAPVLVVMSMNGVWPNLASLGTSDGHDVQLRPTSWIELDRFGHYACRVETEEGTYDVSSWLSPEQVAEMAPVRDSQRDYLQQLADLPDPEDTGPTDLTPAEEPPEENE